jgi:hypothetical protein
MSLVSPQCFQNFPRGFQAPLRETLLLPGLYALDQLPPHRQLSKVLCHTECLQIFGTHLGYFRSVCVTSIHTDTRHGRSPWIQSNSTIGVSIQWRIHWILSTPTTKMWHHLNHDTHPPKTRDHMYTRGPDERRRESNTGRTALEKHNLTAFLVILDTESN